MEGNITPSVNDTKEIDPIDAERTELIIHTQLILYFKN